MNLTLQHIFTVIDANYKNKAKSRFSIHDYCGGGLIEVRFPWGIVSRVRLLVPVISAWSTTSDIE